MLNVRPTTMTSVADTPETQSYREMAHAFCEIIDQHDKASPVEWLIAVHQILPALYTAALGLPEVEPDDSDRDQDSYSVAPGLSLGIGALLGKWDVYSLVFDGYEDKDIVKASLAGDLSEIYEDIKRTEASKPATGALTNDLLWQWRFDFTSHWGRHAVSALQAFHTLRFAHHVDQLPETFGRRS